MSNTITEITAFLVALVGVLRVVRVSRGRMRDLTRFISALALLLFVLIAAALFFDVSALFAAPLRYGNSPDGSVWFCESDSASCSLTPDFSGCVPLPPSSSSSISANLPDEVFGYSSHSYFGQLDTVSPGVQLSHWETTYLCVYPPVGGVSLWLAPFGPSSAVGAVSAIETSYKFGASAATITYSEDEQSENDGVCLSSGGGTTAEYATYTGPHFISNVTPLTLKAFFRTKYYPDDEYPKCTLSQVVGDSQINVRFAYVAPLPTVTPEFTPEFTLTPTPPGGLTPTPTGFATPSEWDFLTGTPDIPVSPTPTPAGGGGGDQDPTPWPTLTPSGGSTPAPTSTPGDVYPTYTPYPTHTPYPIPTIGGTPAAVSLDINPIPIVTGQGPSVDVGDWGPILSMALFIFEEWCGLGWLKAFFIVLILFFMYSLAKKALFC